jgi:acetoacetate decarboxylase
MTRDQLPAAASSGAFRRSWRNRPCGTEVDTLVGTLDYGPIRVATGTMGYKHSQANLSQVRASLAATNFLLKIIPHVDGSPRICELVEYHLEDVTIKGAWTGPAALHLSPHALAPVADLPVLEVVSAIHIVADLTLGLGKVVHDYLQQPSRRLMTRLPGAAFALAFPGRLRVLDEAFDAARVVVFAAEGEGTPG